MNTIIEKRGDSFFLQIPDTFAEIVTPGEKTDVQLSIEGDRIVVKPVSKPQYTSNELSNGFVSEEYPDITQTRTWELCGSLEIAKPDSRYTVGYDDQERIITNYAEHIDEVLIENTHD